MLGNNSISMSAPEPKETMPLTILEIASPQCVAEEFDGEIVALNMDTGTYFSVRDAAARLWHDLANGHAVEALVEQAGADTPLGRAIVSFVEAIQKEGLMRPAQSMSAPTAATAPLLANAEETQMPVLEAFHDMQSLLLLDPVHEVDEEEGWPKVPSSRAVNADPAK